MPNNLVEALKTIQQFIQSANKPELQAAFEALLKAMQGQTAAPAPAPEPEPAPVGTGRVPYNAGARPTTRIM